MLMGGGSCRCVADVGRSKHFEDTTMPEQKREENQEEKKGSRVERLKKYLVHR